MKWFIAVLVVVSLGIVSCGKGKTDNSADTTKNDTLQQTVDSPYYGCFKGKSEFSFTTTTTMYSEYNGTKHGAVTTRHYYVKNGMEAMKMLPMSVQGNVFMSEPTIVYIIVDKTLYAIREDRKRFYTESEVIMNGDVFAAVREWTRENTNAYDYIAQSGERKKEMINNVEYETFSVDSRKYTFDSDKKLIRYIPDISDENGIVEFTDYKFSAIDDSIFKLLETINNGEWEKVDSISYL